MSRYSLPLVLACGSGIAMISLGERSAFGLFQADMAGAREWGRETFAFAFALQNLLWGIGQPFAGALADRYGTFRVLACGGVMYALALAGTVYMESATAVTIMFGLLLGIAMSACSFTLVISAFGRIVSPAQRSLAFGVGTAAGSLGMFLFGPLAAVLINQTGWENAMTIFAAIALSVVLFAIPLRGKAEVDRTGPQQSLGAALKEAIGYKSYVLLVFGFFVCGFHVAFIIAHMPSYLVDLGMGPAVGGTAIALIGLFNVVGSLVAGAIGQRYSKAYSLAILYALRSIAIVVFVMVPVTPFSVIVFSSVMGLLWLSTVPLTSGLVAVMFGPRYMATLFGLVFFSHQVGSFMGVWLGGLIYARTGSYDLLWYIGIALGVFAAVVHLPIRDAPSPRLAGAPAAA
ncbi:transport transmembrane protein [Stappia sp. 22II-S9-Z10]|nr:transport transmembrane protein [Stappia sp. 22II-S9-Z10]